MQRLPSAIFSGSGDTLRVSPEPSSRVRKLSFRLNSAHFVCTIPTQPKSTHLGQIESAIFESFLTRSG